MELIVALVGALAGVIAAEAAHVWRQRRARGREQELADKEAVHLEQRQLEKLRRLLHRTRELFVEQARKRDALAARLKEGHPGFRPSRDGYEYLFAELYPKMTPDEKTLHQMIAGYTEELLVPANRQLQAWLAAAQGLRARYAKDPQLRDFAHQLKLLEQHLDGWFVKYQRVFSDDPARALVYLADEENLGPRFPQALEPLLQSLIDGPSAEAPTGSNDDLDESADESRARDADAERDAAAHPPAKRKVHVVIDVPVRRQSLSVVLDAEADPDVVARQLAENLGLSGPGWQLTLSGGFRVAEGSRLRLSRTGDQSQGRGPSGMGPDAERMPNEWHRT